MKTKKEKKEDKEEETGKKIIFIFTIIYSLTLWDYLENFGFLRIYIDFWNIYGIIRILI